MNAPDRDTLILFHYGELSAAQEAAVRGALAADPAVQSAYASLLDTLETVDRFEAPARDEQYGRRVWARIEPALEDTHGLRRGWEWLCRLPWMQAGAAASVLVIALLAFMAGRVSVPVESLFATDAKERVLLEELTLHLAGSERLLAEVSNRNVDEPSDLMAERNWARILLAANRLYRLAAANAGQARIVDLLADMEPVLIDLANSEDTTSPETWRGIQDSIETRGLLFRVRTAKLPPSAQEPVSDKEDNV